MVPRLESFYVVMMAVAVVTGMYWQGVDLRSTVADALPHLVSAVVALVILMELPRPRDDRTVHVVVSGALGGRVGGRVKHTVAGSLDQHHYGEDASDDGDDRDDDHSGDDSDNEPRPRSRTRRRLSGGGGGRERRPPQHASPSRQTGASAENPSAHA